MDTTYQHALGKSLIVDGKNSRIGIGHRVNEAFDDTEAHIRFIPNNKQNPWFLVGIVIKPLKKGEEILTCYGKDYWCRRAIWNAQTPVTKAKCKEYYGIKVTDIY